MVTKGIGLLPRPEQPARMLLSLQVQIPTPDRSLRYLPICPRWIQVTPPADPLIRASRVVHLQDGKIRDRNTGKAASNRTSNPATGIGVSIRRGAVGWRRWVLPGTG
jgi:hypothetical protein